MNPAALLAYASLSFVPSLRGAHAMDHLQPSTQESKQVDPEKGQASQTALARRFEKARLVEKVERDYEGAARLYRSLAMAPEASKELQGRSWLRLAICWDQLGQKEKARLAYEKAATSSALVAAEAKARLQGQDPKRFEYRVRLQIDKLIEGKDLAAARRDLLWIGEESVPFLIAAIEEEKLNLDFVVRATDILLALGGPEAIRFLEKTSKSEDTLLRRALVRGFTSKVGPDLAKAMGLYLADPDPRTRDEALRRLISVVPTSTILDFLENGPESIQDYLINRFLQAPNSTAPMPSRSGRWNWNYQAPDAAQNGERLLKLYQRWFGEEIPAFLRKGPPILRDHVLWDQLLQCPKGWPALAQILRHADNQSQIPTYIPWTKATVPSPRQILELAKALPPYPLNRDPNQPYELRMRQEWLSQQLRKMIAPDSKRNTAVPLLGTDFMEVVPELAALDYDAQGILSMAIQKLAQAKHLRMVVELIPKLYSTEHLVWISQQTPGVDLLPVYRKSLTYMWEQRKTGGSRFTNASLVAMLYKSLLRREVPGMAAFMMEETRRHPSLYTTAAQGLLAWKQPNLKELKQLLILPSQRELRSEKELRGKVFMYLAKAAVKDMGTDFGRADALGAIIRIPTGPSTTRAVTGVRWLLVEDPRATPGPHAHAYTQEQLGKIIRNSLIAGGTSSWTDITDVLRRSRPLSFGMAGGTPSYRVSDPILSGIIQALPHAPRGMRMQQLVKSLSFYEVKDYPSMRGLYLWMLEDEDPQNQARALQGLRVSDFPDLGERCLTALASKSPDVQMAALRRLSDLHYSKGFSRVVPLLRSADSKVRSRAVTTLVAMDPKRGLAAVTPMIRDSGYSVRLSVIQVCRSSLEPSVTGTLLIGLQDGNESVRKAAQAALDAIRFYHEQKSFWDTWNQRSKLGYANPAEALLAQAQKDQPLKIRIQAIRSLGTLGDPGSLPFLIQLMKGGNAEIQKAAEQALDRINAKK